jgi:Icc-related predicted phosphoesterase
MDRAAQSLNDHRLIRTALGAPFTPRDALREHVVSRKWLERELEKPFSGRTVVLTHHAPHEFSVHPRYRGDLLNAAFASHLPHMVERADLWVHGHTHDGFDYTVGRCRVVANPLGYPRNLSSASSVAEVAFENKDFKPNLIVDV